MTIFRSPKHPVANAVSRRTHRTYLSRLQRHLKHKERLKMLHLVLKAHEQHEKDSHGSVEVPQTLTPPMTTEVAL